MPLYEYKCSCGKRFDRLLKLAEYDTPQTCECGQVAEKQLSAPAVFGDFAEEDAKLEEAFAETAVKLVEAMPAAQKEQLGKALETSEVAVVRQ
jgi:putative FmdB family regulatory protein